MTPLQNLLRSGEVRELRDDLREHLGIWQEVLDKRAAADAASKELAKAQTALADAQQNAADAPARLAAAKSSPALRSRYQYAHKRLTIRYRHSI